MMQIIQMVILLIPTGFFLIKLPMLGAIHPTGSDFLICMAMFGSGVKIGMTHTQMKVLLIR